jgi:hypothetical protein
MPGFGAARKQGGFCRGSEGAQGKRFRDRIAQYPQEGYSGTGMSVPVQWEAAARAMADLQLHVV